MHFERLIFYQLGLKRKEGRGSIYQDYFTKTGDALASILEVTSLAYVVSLRTAKISELRRRDNHAYILLRCQLRKEGLPIFWLVMEST
jgi:hypothetical protein